MYNTVGVLSFLSLCWQSVAHRVTSQSYPLVFGQSLCNHSSPWFGQDMHFAEALKPQDVEAGVGACFLKGVPPCPP